MPHGITQCYLPPGRGDIPALIAAEAGTQLSDPEGMQGWVDLDARLSRWRENDACWKWLSDHGHNRGRNLEFSITVTETKQFWHSGKKRHSGVADDTITTCAFGTVTQPPLCTNCNKLDDHWRHAVVMAGCSVWWVKRIFAILCKMLRLEGRRDPVMWHASKTWSAVVRCHQFFIDNRVGRVPSTPLISAWHQPPPC